jgi:alpha-tubulin suppressor-like RCC1 family protein
MLFFMSAVASASTATAEVLASVLTPSSADSPVALQVAVSCATPGAEIHYTLNGEEPTKFDPAVASGGSLTISRNALLKAKAWAGEESGPTATEDYRITGSISCGYQHGLALSVAGRIWSWGEQGGGRLGNGNVAAADVATPARVLLGAGYFDNGMVIAAGYDHTQVIDKDGLVWSFGENGLGQLGNNSTTDSALPVRVLRSTTAGDHLGACTGIDAGQEFSVALLPAGEPVAWGSQATGRLGNGTNSSTPRKYAAGVIRGDDPSYPPLAGIKQVSAGHSHGLAREPNSSEQTGGAGRVWVWGHNHVGQLGRGDTSGITRAMPMLLDENTELADALDVSGGGAHTAVVRWHPTASGLDGTVWSCGSQTDGRLGNGTTASGSVTYPVKAIKEGGSDLTGVQQVSAGPSHTLAVDADGHVWAWGNNQYGQLGDGTTTHSGHARMVKDAAGTGVLGNIVMVSAGGESTNGRSMALAADGTIWVWGRNNEGQLGNGQTASVTALPVAHAQNHVDEGEPAVSLSYTIDGFSEPYGATLEAVPTHSGPEGLGHLTSVKFYVDGGLAATVASAPWTTALPDLPPGQHHAFALATDENGVTAMSQSVTFDASDPDNDGLPSAWETQHGFDPEDPADATGDPDQDQLNNSQEFQYSTNPSDKDTDDDYVPDGIEVFGI